MVFAGDDVGANTSAIESDSRVLATAADVPVLCPSTAQEAKEMTKYAFELSEELGCPVVVRSVCQLMMAQTVVSVDARETVPHKSEFAPNPRRVVMFEPGTMSAVTIHRFIHKNLEKCQGNSDAEGLRLCRGRRGTHRTGVLRCKLQSDSGGYAA